jgi:hypothetical protein
LVEKKNKSIKTQVLKRYLTLIKTKQKQKKHTQIPSKFFYQTSPILINFSILKMFEITFQFGVEKYSHVANLTKGLKLTAIKSLGI